MSFFYIYSKHDEDLLSLVESSDLGKYQKRDLKKKMARDTQKKSTTQARTQHGFVALASAYNFGKLSRGSRVDTRINEQRRLKRNHGVMRQEARSWTIEGVIVEAFGSVSHRDMKDRKVTQRSLDQQGLVSAVAQAHTNATKQMLVQSRKHAVESNPWLIYCWESDATPVKVKFGSLLQSSLAPAGRYWTKKTLKGRAAKWEMKTYAEMKASGMHIPSVGVVEVFGQTKTLVWPEDEDGTLVLNFMRQTERQFLE